MPKQKTNKSIAKRIKVTGKGKLMRHHSGAGHLQSSKNQKRLRRLRSKVEVSDSYTKQMKRLLGM